MLNGGADVRSDRGRIAFDGIRNVSFASNVQLFELLFSFALGFDNNLTHMIIRDRVQSIAHYWLDVFALLGFDDDFEAIHFLIAFRSAADEVLHAMEKAVARFDLDNRLADKVHSHHFCLGAFTQDRSRHKLKPLPTTCAVQQQIHEVRKGVHPRSQHRRAESKAVIVDKDVRHEP